MSKNKDGHDVYTISEIENFIVDNALAADGGLIDENAYCIIGSPGCGKTFVAHQIAAKLGWYLQPYPIGWMQKGDTAMPLPRWDKEGKPTFGMAPLDIWTHVKEETVVVLDEWPNSDEGAIQALREATPGGAPIPNVAGYVLPKKLLWIMTGNQKGRGGKNVTPLSNLAEKTRVRVMMVNEMPDMMVGDWVMHYAMQHGVDDRVIGFLNRHPDFILEADPSPDPYVPYMCPRSWTRAAQYLKATSHSARPLPDHSAKMGVTLAVGEKGMMNLYADMAENMLASAEDYLSGKAALPKRLPAATQAVVRVIHHVVEYAAQQKGLLDQFASVSVDWPKEAMSVVWAALDRDYTWWEAAGGTEVFTNHPEWTRNHHTPKMDAKARWAKWEAKERKA